MSYFDIYEKRLNRYGLDYQSRIQGKREQNFDLYLQKSIYRVDFEYNDEYISGSFERYKQDDTKTLHYLLVKENYASIYSLFFNKFRRGRIEFTSKQLEKYIESIVKEDNSYNVNTVTTDIMVLLRMYQKTDNTEGRIELEDMYSGIFNDLQFMSKLRTEKYGEKGLVDWFRISNEDKHSLPAEIVLFSILDNYPGMETISFKELEIGVNSPGIVLP